MNLWLNSIHQLENLLNHLKTNNQISPWKLVCDTHGILLARYGFVHVVDSLSSVRVNLSSDALLGPHVFRLEVTELTFAFFAVFLDFILSFLLCLLQPSGFAWNKVFVENDNSWLHSTVTVTPIALFCELGFRGDNLRLRASDTFSAALFSAARSCWMPCVWLAIF